MKRTLFFLILSATFSMQARSQGEMGVKVVGGYLIAHHTVMQYLVQSHAYGLEFYYEKETSGEKYWHNVYRRPEIGYTFFIGNPGNPQNIGTALAAVPYIKFHPVYKKLFRFNIKSGMGIGYLSKYFNRIENNKNTAIGSHFNVAFNVGFEPELHFARWDVGAGISFFHFSNGALRVPNLGYNIPELHFNLGYRLKATTDAPAQPATQNTSGWKTTTWQILLNFGIKEILPAGGPKYGVMCFSTLMNRAFTPVSHFTVAAEVFYNNAYHAALESHYAKSIPGTDALRAGLAIGYGLNLGHLNLTLQNGFYVYSPYRSYDGPLYHRLQARYTFDQGFMLQAGLKTHFAKADNLELGIGYCLGKATK